MDAKRLPTSEPRQPVRRSFVVLTFLLSALIGSLLIPGSASAASSVYALTNGSTISVRSGDLCKLKPLPPTTGRKYGRNIGCVAPKTLGIPPAAPSAPTVQVLSTGDTVFMYSADGCVIKPAAPTSGRKWVRNFTCNYKAPAPPAQPPPPPGGGGSSGLAGTTVGAAQYAVPAGAIVVDPNGNNQAAGTSAAPMRTLNGAIDRSASGATIVMRAGSYHESVIIPDDKRLTIQAWPGEAVWLDGSSVVSGWVASGGRWFKDGWTTEFDSSPTYDRGAPDNTEDSWAFVNPSYPMAAHPDQMWIGGVAQRQVGSLAQVTAGTFFHDEAANRLWLGSNPAGGEVRASDLIRAMRARGPNSIVRGIGMRRYAPSVPDMGAITIESRNITFENVAITDMATTGLHVGVGTTPGTVLRKVYIARSGMLGASANYADNMLLDRVLAEANNTERFNMAPVSGGVKIARTRGVVVRDSVFRANRGPGLWMDVSVYDMTVVGNEMRDNANHGTSLELSAKAVFANNIVTNNDGFGLKVSNTSGVDVWNNTFSGNGASMWVVQDSRRPSNDPSGRDNRYYPDPTMTWVIGPMTVMNNVFANQSGAAPSSRRCMLCVEDVSGQLTAEQMRVSADTNIYHRINTSSPTWVAWWSNGPAGTEQYTSVPSFRSGTGQEAAGQSNATSGFVDGNGTVLGALANTARALPANVAAVTGQVAGTRYHGAWPR